MQIWKWPTCLRSPAMPKHRQQPKQLQYSHQAVTPSSEANMSTAPTHITDAAQQQRQQQISVLSTASSAGQAGDLAFSDAPAPNPDEQQQHQQISEPAHPRSPVAEAADLVSDIEFRDMSAPATDAQLQQQSERACSEAEMPDAPAPGAGDLASDIELSEAAPISSLDLPSDLEMGSDMWAPTTDAQQQQQSENACSEAEMPDAPAPGAGDLTSDIELSKAALTSSIDLPSDLEMGSDMRAPTTDAQQQLQHISAGPEPLSIKAETGCVPAPATAAPQQQITYPIVSEMGVATAPTTDAHTTDAPQQQSTASLADAEMSDAPALNTSAPAMYAQQAQQQSVFAAISGLTAEVDSAPAPTTDAPPPPQQQQLRQSAAPVMSTPATGVYDKPTDAPAPAQQAQQSAASGMATPDVSMFDEAPATPKKKPRLQRRHCKVGVPECPAPSNKGNTRSKRGLQDVSDAATEPADGDTDQPVSQKRSKASFQREDKDSIEILPSQPRKDIAQLPILTMNLPSQPKICLGVFQGTRTKKARRRLQVRLLSALKVMSVWFAALHVKMSSR